MSNEDLPARKSVQRCLSLLAENAASGGVAAAGIGMQEARWTRQARSQQRSSSSGEPSSTPSRCSCCRICGACWECIGFGRWHTEQCAIYGCKFVAFQIFVNFMYGVMTSFLYFFLVYFLDQNLGLSPSESLKFQGILNTGPLAKPFIGLVSDNISLCGSYRRNYYIMTCLVAAASYLFIAITPSTYWSAGGAFFAAYFFGYSWCGVILYAMTAEKARMDPEEGAANLNALQWGWFAIGGLIADAVAGPIFNFVGDAKPCFFILSGLYLLMAACGLLYDDDTEIVKEFEDNCGSQTRKLFRSLNPCGPTHGVILRCIVFIFLTWAVVPDLFYGTTYYFYTSPAHGCVPSAPNSTGPVQCGCMHSAEPYCVPAVDTCGALPNDDNGCSFTSEAGGLEFGAEEWGLISVIGDLAMLGGSLLYGACLTATPLRTLFVVLQLLNAGSVIFNVMLAMGMHTTLGIDARIFAAIGNAFFWFVWQLKALPVYTLAAEIVPTGIEATLMSIISAVNDLGGTAAKLVASVCTEYFGVQSVPGSSCQPYGQPCIDWQNLGMLYFAQAILTLVPVIFVPLVPSKNRISEVVSAMDKRTAEEQGNEAVILGASRASRAAACSGWSASTFSRGADSANSNLETRLLGSE